MLHLLLNLRINKKNLYIIAYPRIIVYICNVKHPSQRMFQSWFVVSELQSDTYYYQDL